MPAETGKEGRVDTSAKVLIVVMAALNALGLIFAVYLKSYVGEKAKHFATKEDLQQLVREVREKAVASKEGEISGKQNKLAVVIGQNDRLVRSSEEIKHTISERQRIQELKREAAYDAIKATATMSQATSGLSAAMNSLKNNVPTEGGHAFILEEIKKLRERYDKSVETIWQLLGIFTLLFDHKTVDALQAINTTGSDLFASAIDLDTTEDRGIKLNAFSRAQVNLNLALQEQLNKTD